MIKYSKVFSLLFFLIIGAIYLAKKPSSFVPEKKSLLKTAIDKKVAEKKKKSPLATDHVHEASCKSCSAHKSAPKAVEYDPSLPADSPLQKVPKSKFKSDVLALEGEARLNAEAVLANLDLQHGEMDDIHVDKNGGIFYSCFKKDYNSASRVGEAHIAEFASEPGTERATVSISSPPIRHSKPGATNVLYLDFNGGVVTGTAWNDSDGVNSWSPLAYSLDVDRTTFSDSEQNAIIEIWSRVAENYAPFDIDVTTEEPAVFTNRTAHAYITPDVDANGVNLPHNGSGGIAYVGVFGSSSYASQYAVSWNQDYGPKDAAAVISHEVGHNMGLSHDGTTEEAYYDGHENDSIHWGPIMGSGYYGTVTQWSKGEYYNANQTQDDLSIITSRVPYRSDDHSNSNSGSSSVTVNGTAISASGIIERNTDRDVFRFVSGAGPISLSAENLNSADYYGIGNLDIVLELRNSANSLLATSNPLLDTESSLSYNITSAGTYYIHIKPTGLGNPLSSTPTGYTVYGSLGQYAISGTIVGFDAPTAPESFADSYSVRVGSSLIVSAANGVLANDTDANNDSLSAVKVRDPLNGTVSLNSDGSFTYTPNNGFEGVDTFRYWATDGSLTSNTSTVSIAVVSEIFPNADGTLPAGWESDGASWSGDNSTFSEGSWSLRAGDINNSQSTSIEYSGVFTQGTLSFDYKVSSERSYDFFNIYIDDMTTPVLSISGIVDWTSFSQAIPAGTHVIRLEYSKDTSVSSGSDTVWVDNMNLPGNTTGPTQSYDVSFLPGAHGTLSGSVNQIITRGGSATAPTVTANAGYSFTGWDVSFSNITADTVVTAQYEEGSVLGMPRYRVYNPNNGHHHWMTSLAEYNFLVGVGWLGEGFDHRVFVEQDSVGQTSSQPYYRLYNPNSGEHHWSLSQIEYDSLETVGWTKEGIDGYVFSTQATSTIALYRLYNPNSGFHHYTTSELERNTLIAVGWHDEGVSGYVFPRE